MRYLYVPFRDTQLHGIIFGTTTPRILFIHGASEDGSARFDMLRQHLSKTGIASAAFDFIGAGQTGGEMLGSSLKERFEQSCAVIDSVHIHKPLVLVAASMGADTAIRLTQKYSVGALILFVPGVYARSAYTIPFGDEFSLILREDQSWEDSDAWDILAEFTGSLLVVAAQNDEVVPRALIDRLDESTPHARYKELFTVSHAPHALLPYLNDHHEEFARVFERVYHTIVSSPSV